MEEAVFSKIGRIRQVKACVLVDGRGQIISRGRDWPQKLSKMICECGQTLLAVGKNKFKYVSFSRPGKMDILIFPVGRYYLGVIKKEGFEDFEAACAVLKLLPGQTGTNREER